MGVKWRVYEKKIILKLRIPMSEFFGENKNVLKSPLVLKELNKTIEEKVKSNNVLDVQNDSMQNSTLVETNLKSSVEKVEQDINGIGEIYYEMEKLLKYIDQLVDIQAATITQQLWHSIIIEKYYEFL